MAHVWLCALLACDLLGPAGDRQGEDFQRGVGSHLPYGDQPAVRLSHAVVQKLGLVSKKNETPFAVRRRVLAVISVSWKTFAVAARKAAAGSLCLSGTTRQGSANALTPEVTITTYCFPFRPK